MAQRPKPMRVGRLVVGFIGIVLSLIYLVPLYWMIEGSFTSATNTLKVPPSPFPSPATLQNYRDLFDFRDTTSWLMNSILVSGVVAIGATVTSTMAGYVLAVKQFPGRSLAFWTVIAGMALPNATILIPLFLIMRDLGWIDSYQAMIVPLIAFPFGVFLVRQFSASLPSSLFDAAKLDGANEYQIFRYVAAPLLRPASAAVAIFCFMGAWNDYIWQVVIINSDDKKTLPVGIATVIRGYDSLNVGLLMAGATVAFIPMLIVFAVSQRSFRKGITLGAMKG